MGIEIRLVTIDDIDSLHMIQNRDGRKHSRKLDEYPLAEWIMDKNNPFLIAFHSAAPAGFLRARIKGNESKIDHFSVVKTHQFKGVEEALLREVEAKIPHGTVEAHIPKTNTKLRDFYLSQGYALADELPELFGKGRAGLIFRKSLDVPLFRKAQRIGKRETKKRVAKGEIKKSAVLEENLQRLDEISEPAAPQQPEGEPRAE